MTIERVMVLGDGRHGARRFADLHPTYIDDLDDIEAALEDGGGALWISDVSPLLLALVHAMARRAKRRHDHLLVLEPVPPDTLAVLDAVFARVVGPSAILLPLAELSEVLAAPDRSDRCIGGVIQPWARVGVLYRGDLSTLVVPLSVFEPSGTGLAPDFSRFSVRDFGATLGFGDYEAAFDAVLYERDPEFRRRLKAQRLAEEQTFGASLRRLRKQRQLARTDFPGVDPRTIARIETGEVGRPHGRTLAAIARVLQVQPADIEQF
jgi:hypothetical protein